MIENYKVKNFGEVKITYPAERHTHCVYEVKTSDGFKIIGQTDEELHTRTKKRLTKKKEFDMFKNHLVKDKTLFVSSLCDVEDSFTKNVIEQYLICKEWEKHISSFFKNEGKNVKVDFYNVSAYRKNPIIKEYVDEKCGNLNLDHKEDLRIYLAHKEKYPTISKILSNLD